MKISELNAPICELGEGPIWDAERNCLWWVDINVGDLHQFHLATENHKKIKVGNYCSAVILCKSENLILTVKDGFAQLNLQTGVSTYLAKKEEELPNNRFNDAKCDPAGRIWAGTMDFVGNRAEAGGLYTLEKNLHVQQKLANISCSNGMAWSADEQSFYYIDSPTRKIAVYSYNKATGEINNKRTIVKISHKEGMPDGMTIDTDGMLWVALWGGSALACYNPTNGKCIRKIELPVSNVTSCTFGGENLEDLYITTARAGLSNRDLKNQPLAGRVFVCKNTGSKGLPAHRFAYHPIFNSTKME